MIDISPQGKVRNMEGLEDGRISINLIGKRKVENKPESKKIELVYIIEKQVACISLTGEGLNYSRLLDKNQF